MPPLRCKDMRFIPFDQEALLAGHRAWQASTACERELSAFMAVAALRRCSEPHRTSAMASSAAQHEAHVKVASTVLLQTFLPAGLDWAGEQNIDRCRGNSGRPLTLHLQYST